MINEKLVSQLTREDVDFLEAWEKLLRETKIPQVRQAVFHDDYDISRGSCCLGIACLVYEPEAKTKNEVDHLLKGSNGAGMLLPSGTKLNDLSWVNFIALNDYEEKSFHEIADVVAEVIQHAKANLLLDKRINHAKSYRSSHTDIKSVNIPKL